MASRPTALRRHLSARAALRHRDTVFEDSNPLLDCLWVSDPDDLEVVYGHRVGRGEVSYCVTHGFFDFSHPRLELGFYEKASPRPHSRRFLSHYCDTDSSPPENKLRRLIDEGYFEWLDGEFSPGDGSGPDVDPGACGFWCY